MPWKKRTIARILHFPADHSIARSDTLANDFDMPRKVAKHATVDKMKLVCFHSTSSPRPRPPLPSLRLPLVHQPAFFYPAVCLIVEGEKLTAAVPADPASSASTANHQDHRRNGEVCSLPATGAPASRSRSTSSSAHCRRSSSHDHGPCVIDRSDSHQSPRTRPYQLN